MAWSSGSCFTFSPRGELRSLKWRSEHGAEDAIRNGLASFREEVRQNHRDPLRAQPWSSKETILTHEVATLKRRLDELEQRISGLAESPEAG
jgi:hypothetical protein